MVCRSVLANAFNHSRTGSSPYADRKKLQGSFLVEDIALVYLIRYFHGLEIGWPHHVPWAVFEKRGLLWCKAVPSSAADLAVTSAKTMDELHRIPLEAITRIVTLVPPPSTHRNRNFGLVAPNSPSSAALRLAVQRARANAA